MRKTSAVLLTTILVLGSAAFATAAPIFAPVAGVIDAGGPGSGTLTETFNQAGLFTGYTSGVTDFDTYLASNPKHTLAFSGYEWFSNFGTSAAMVTYDFGAVVGIDRLALWNEESSGIGTLNLLYSVDNVNFFALATGLTPTDNPLADYGADVFSFAPTSARYVRFDMSSCPQPDPGSYPSCAIGEVAFRQAAPEPAMLALLGVGLLGLAHGRTRRSGR